MPNDTKGVGARIRILRRTKALSQENLADQAGLSHNTLWRIEAGQCAPRHETIQKLCTVLGVAPEELAPVQEVASQTQKVFRLTETDEPALAMHWSDMLSIFARSIAFIRPNDLHQVIRNELALINQQRRQASGASRAALVVVEAQWAEFASWIAFNLGKQQESWHWLERSLDLARQAEHKPLVSYTLMRFAQHAADFGDASMTTGFAREAASISAITSRDIALCKVREAHGLAIAGNGKDFRGLIDTALKLVLQADATSVDDDPRTLGQHCTQAYVLAHLGYCQLLSGDTAGAIEALTNALSTGFSDAFRYDEGLARCWLALSYACANEIDAAASEGMQALTIGCNLGSTRILRNLGKVDARFGNCKRPSTNMIQFRAAYVATLGRRR